MLKAYLEIIGISLVALLLDWLTKKSCEIDYLLLILSVLIYYYKLVKIEMIVYILHIVYSCKFISKSEIVSEERIGWVVSSCEAWYLGLNYDYKSKVFSVIGKILTFLWLNYIYGFDIISPNFIAYIPVIVSRLYYQDFSQSTNPTDVIITNSHFQQTNTIIQLPILCKFLPLDESPPVISLFYQSGAYNYQYNTQSFQVISIVFDSKIHLKVLKI